MKTSDIQLLFKNIAISKKIISSLATKQQICFQTKLLHDKTESL